MVKEASTRARVALVGIDDSSSSTLKPLFEQFGIDAVDIAEDFERRLTREKFDGCVVRLDEHAGPILTTVRKSAVNYRMVIYGLCERTSDALPYSRYGINALLMLPLNRREALKAIKGTYLLVVHEFRRYVRIPLATDVDVFTNRGKLAASSQEVSGGGMSLKIPVRLALGETVEVSFQLPNGPTTPRIPAVVRWYKEADQLTGVRFEDDNARIVLKEWIDKYLGIS